MCCVDRLNPQPFGDLRLNGLSPGLVRIPMYPYVALRCPTYRENSHANHTWHQPSHQTACFKGSEAPSLWVRFPSPAPLFVVWRVPSNRPVPTVSTRLRPLL